VTSISRNVLIIGGGESEIQASLDLAGIGFLVHIVETSPTLCGRLTRTRQDSSYTNSSIQALYPKMVECSRHPRIALHSYSEVIGVGGSIGHFRVKVLEKPRYVRAEKCIGCGACADKCPVKVPDELGAGKGSRKAIYMQFPISIPRIMTIDPTNCLFFTKNICKVCEKFCTSNAIDYGQKPHETELNVDDILALAGRNSAEASAIPKTITQGIHESVQSLLTTLGETPTLSTLKKQRVGSATAEVDASKCNACGACEAMCASRAPKVTLVNGQKVSQINPLLCEGCGTCVAGCPRFAITLGSYADDQVLDKIKMALVKEEETEDPTILMFTCMYCGFAVPHSGGAEKLVLPPNVKIVRLPCSGRVDPFIAVAALRSGADGVIISGCRPGYCHFLIGNEIAERRYESLRIGLESSGIGIDRVHLQWATASDPKSTVNVMKEMTEKLRTLPPLTR
jgi:heterodisulfide reductase subunit A-like polyferredoxin/coenzyme F420-reducing hydrogenase delta subunit